MSLWRRNASFIMYKRFSFKILIQQVCCLVLSFSSHWTCLGIWFEFILSLSFGSLWGDIAGRKTVCVYELRQMVIVYEKFHPEVIPCPFWSINCWMTLKIKFMFHFLDNLFTYLSTKISFRNGRLSCLSYRCWYSRRTYSSPNRAFGLFPNRNVLSAGNTSKQNKTNGHAKRGTVMTLNDI